MKKVSFMSGILALAITLSCTAMLVSCAEEEIAPKTELLDGGLLDGDGNDNADGEKGNDNDDVIDIDADSGDGNDNADGEKGNDNDDVIDIDLGL